MIRPLLDRMLNGVTMYRLMLYYLGALVLAAFALGFTGKLFVNPMALSYSLVVIGATCWVTNRAFSRLMDVPVNVESVHITALILVLILPPVANADPMGTAGLVLASVVAIGSKFLLTIEHKHIFNPVAIGAVASGLTLGMPAVWWVGGNMLLAPIVILGGLLVVQKVQRFDMIAVYALSNLALIALTTPVGMLAMTMKQSLLYSPLFFAGFAMLTEPLTSAHGRVSRLVYGAIVGILSVPAIGIGSFHFSPEMAFLVGNVYAWAASPKGRFRMTLVRVEEVAQNCYDYIFHSNRELDFRAGQYLDWTLAVPAPDSRGNRRPFTIASAPGSREVRLGVKFYPGPSAFKRGLLGMQAGDTIFGSQIAGTFTLPRRHDVKLAFLAGGIGITPFRSMIEDLVRRGEPRDIVLIYGNATPEDIAYQELLARAERDIGLRVVHVVEREARAEYGHYAGRIDAELLLEAVPDIAERLAYISGPGKMVSGLRGLLRRLGVPRSQIRTDFFPGFA